MWPPLHVAMLWAKCASPKMRMLCTHEAVCIHRQPNSIYTPLSVNSPFLTLSKPGLSNPITIPSQSVLGVFNLFFFSKSEWCMMPQYYTITIRHKTKTLSKRTHWAKGHTEHFCSYWFPCHFYFSSPSSCSLSSFPFLPLSSYATIRTKESEKQNKTNKFKQKNHNEFKA